MVSAFATFARPELGRFVPYTGPLYNRHGREITPARVSPYSGGPLRPCC